MRTSPGAAGSGWTPGVFREAMADQALHASPMGPARPRPSREVAARPGEPDRRFGQMVVVPAEVVEHLDTVLVAVGLPGVRRLRVPRARELRRAARVH